MNSGTIILLAIIASVIVITVVTVATMRRIIRGSGTQHLHQNGIELTDSGIDFLGLLWAGRRHADYSELESVELISFPAALFSLLFFRYGLSLRAIYTRIPYHFVLIKFKNPRPSQYLLLTPENPALFVAQLRLRISSALSPPTAEKSP
jgi:hypothetical protein